MADKNFRVIFDHEQYTTVPFDVLKAPASFGPHADTLKVTGKKRKVTVRGLEIWGGGEDCADVNDASEDTDIEFMRWYSGGKYIATLKGNSKNTRLSGQIVKHGSETDVDIGNFSDQGNRPVTGTRLNLTTADGSAVKVRLLNGEMPFIENPTQKYEIKDLRKWWPVYMFFKELFPRKL